MSGMRMCILATLAAVATPTALYAQNGTPTSAPAATPSSGLSIPQADDLMKVIDKATPRDAKGGEWSASVRLAVVFTMLALLPSLLVMVTSFTRIVIVLAFIRRALTTQSIPPTVAIIGLALFLTLFTMSGTFAQINQEAVQPYLADQVAFDEACSRTCQSLKHFMIRQTRDDDLALFVKQAAIERPKSLEELPMYVVIPAFAISEFRTAFEMGCLLFIPFLLVDLVVSGILLSAGMMMLPPSMISLPFKIILFVLVDGWRLVSASLVTSFR